jgi:hypothetical protein
MLAFFPLLETRITATLKKKEENPKSSKLLFSLLNGNFSIHGKRKKILTF